ncbi:MAG: hypothetical protein ACYC5X_04790 [Syntrophales bacterium]
MEAAAKEDLDAIDRASAKIHGLAGLFEAGETAEDLVLQKVDAVGISTILRDCARDIQEALDGLKENLDEQ